MNKIPLVVKAFRLLMEETGLSVDNIYKLIETSKDYNGEDYHRWLVAKFIEACGNIGFQYSDILVHKLRIKVALMAGMEGGISSEVRNFIKDGSLFIGFPDNWFSNEEGFYVSSRLEDITQNKNTFVYLDPSKSDLVQESMLKSYKSNALYIPSILNAWSYEEDFSTTLVMKASTLKSVESAMVDLSESVTVTALNWLPEYVGIPSSLGEDSLLFISIKVDSEGLSGDEEWLTLYDEYTSLSKDFGPTRFSPKGKLFADYLSEKSYPEEEVLGYVSVNGTISVGGNPKEGADYVIPITESTLEDVVVFGACSCSLIGTWGYGEGIDTVSNGYIGYESLVANSIPVFLYGTHSTFENLDVVNKIENALLPKYSSYMSLESKYLRDFCLEFANAMRKASSDLEDKSVYSIRKAVNNLKFEEMYGGIYEKATDFLRKQYKSYIK